MLLTCSGGAAIPEKYAVLVFLQPWVFVRTPYYRINSARIPLYTTSEQLRKLFKRGFRVAINDEQTQEKAHG
jgi:hypothetical protein